MEKLPESEFAKIKKQYIEIRELERQKIIKELNSGTENLLVPAKNRGGRGSVKYTSRKTITPYDLSNWKWIRVLHGDTEFFIDLQSPDTDSCSGNSHVLFDRITFTHQSLDLHIIEKTHHELPLDCCRMKNMLADFEMFVKYVQMKIENRQQRIGD